MDGALRLPTSGTNQCIDRHAYPKDQDSRGITFYSTSYCPYAQRCWIALEYKNIDYRWRECILYSGKPSSKVSLTLSEKNALNPGFIAASPRGLVPALEVMNNEDIVKSHCICDSLVLLEYIEEAFTGSDQLTLLPQNDFIERARIRNGIALFQELVVKSFYGLLLHPSEITQTAEWIC